MLTLPLLVRDTLLGVVRLRHLHPRRPYDEAAVRLVADIAAYTALCIDNAQHYEHAHATALALHGSDPGSLPAAAVRSRPHSATSPPVGAREPGSTSFPSPGRESP